MWPVFADCAPREEKKKKQKQEGCDTEEKTEVSSGGSAVEQGSKGGGGPTQQPLKRGQRVRGAWRLDVFVLWTKQYTVLEFENLSKLTYLKRMHLKRGP